MKKFLKKVFGSILNNKEAKYFHGITFFSNDN